MEVATRIVNAVIDSHSELDVAKIVAVSRQVEPPSDGGGERRGILGNLRSWDSASGLGMEAFQTLHADFEKAVRQCSVRRTGVDYAIVRAPQEVQDFREGSVYPLQLTQPLQSPSSPNPVSASKSVGILDLAEAVTQTLIQDAPSVTYTLSEVPLPSTLDQEGQTFNTFELQASAPSASAPGEDRVPRRAYYSILNSDDADLQVSYMIRERENYLDQLKEDEALDLWWACRLSELTPDDVLYD